MSSTLFKLQIMASDHMVYDGEALSVSLPTTEGSVGILANHSNVIMAVVPGPLEYETEEGRFQEVVSDGLLKVENGEVMILVDTSEKPEDIDEARAKRAEEEAREALKKANTNRDHAMVEAELSRALSRIKASKTKHKF
jgi:F-type H+-transporting ATPase subunit epsilon